MKTSVTKASTAFNLLICSYLLSFSFWGCRSGSSTVPRPREVNLYVWSVYIPDRTLKRFEQETGIHLNYSTYDSNEALLEKIESGVADYDVIVPSDYMVSILKREQLLNKIDLREVPNFKNISARFRNLSYDPGNQYSVPFLWSTSGIGYNKTRVRGPVDSWSVLWDKRYKDRMLMLDDPREAFGVALLWKGYSYNSTDPRELIEAQQLLIVQKPLLKAYNSTSFDELLLAGDVWLTHAWSGNVAMVMEQSSDLDFVIPKEGASLSVENFCIPVKARHLREAHEFINFMLDAKVGGEITNYSYYPNTNEAARQYVWPKILNNPAVYQDDKTLARCELVKDIGPASQLIDRLWTEIKSR
jgi:spermidine/putrescine-binding protein